MVSALSATGRTAAEIAVPVMTEISIAVAAAAAAAAVPPQRCKSPDGYTLFPPLM